MPDDGAVHGVGWWKEVTFDPTSSATPPSPVTIDPSPSYRVTTLVCPSSSECVVDDSNSGVFTFDPAHPVPTLPAVIDGGGALSLSCVSAQLCVALNTERQVATFDPASPSDEPAALSPGPGLTSVACVQADFCAAVDDAGDELTFNPASPSGAQATTIDHHNVLTGVACTGESACVAVDAVGDDITFDPTSPTEPSAPVPTEIDVRSSVGVELTGIACATTSLWHGHRRRRQRAQCSRPFSESPRRPSVTRSIPATRSRASPARRRVGARSSTATARR